MTKEQLDTAELSILIGCAQVHAKQCREFNQEGNADFMDELANKLHRLITQHDKECMARAYIQEGQEQ